MYCNGVNRDKGGPIRALAVLGLLHAVGRIPRALLLANIEYWTGAMGGSEVGDG